LQYTENFILFDVHTNGGIALVNVNINAGRNTQVYDNTSGKFLDYEIEQDNSITFWIENNHSYIIDKIALNIDEITILYRILME
jgi:hypothetical protein